MIDLFTTSKISPSGKLNEADLKRWGRNLLVFLAPLGVIYLLQLSASLQNGALSLESLIPNPTTQGGIELYLINGVLDIFRKLQDSKR